MWARLKTFKLAKGEEDLKSESSTVNEEYRSVFRTKSYAEFQTKAQVFVKKPSSSYSSKCSISDVLLESGQETIATILEKSILSWKPELNGLIQKYFDISAEASRICGKLLKSINQIQASYNFIQRALDTIGDYSPDQVKYVISELSSFHLVNNPISNPNQQEFEQIHETHITVLHNLKAKRKKVARKIKLIKYLKETTGICVTGACGIGAVLATVIAAHTLCGLLMGPAIISLPLTMKKKILNSRLWQTGFLKKLWVQLDVAAKGAYILNRDFDTMSRLVTRLHDEIEHSKAMIQFCLERREDRYPLQEVVKQLRKSGVGFKKQVEELEEHVYLCLVTINRARALVIKEMVKQG
ncbi:hypothetical protein GIB67_036143 [Kingdonia uniflora]|uniref:Uncharacterized protein n=1 Tax=Kingdonia uniflora TaxID=39325 RepID=A0A7J7N9B0_9MAGN|nr:hypothetical protein GIB67_036143 [Kingdonia uniflora]